MKPDSKFPSTKIKLLEATLKLMLAKGFTATTLDDICTEAGVTKGSFFHYFKSKEDVTKATLEFFWHFQQGLMPHAELNRASDPIERLHKYLDFFVQIARNPDIPKSCLAGNLTQELASTHPEIRAICEENFSGHIQALKGYLDEAKTMHAPRTPFDSQSLAEYFITIIQGSFILAKAKQDGTILEQNVEHFRRYMLTLFDTN